MSRRPAGPVELAQLRGWLRAAKGRLTFASLARRASARGMPVSACTLRRALTAGLPSLYTVRAVARGAGADEEEAGRVWVAAEAAVRPRHVRKPAGYVPGRQITTRAGPAGGLISRSALHSALTGRRLPGEELLAAFAAACGAGEETTRALLAARARVVAGPRRGRGRGTRAASSNRPPSRPRNGALETRPGATGTGPRTNPTGMTSSYVRRKTPSTGGWPPGSTASPTTS
ncbi:hypothetical protein ACFQZ0_00515 [Streptomyces erythrogriseus]